ncbi:hypothetical protein C7S17_2850 [Burkholderia thailandensis]|nr:hypothetical protein [Burkholderia thailandensis]
MNRARPHRTSQLLHTQSGCGICAHFVLDDRPGHCVACIRADVRSSVQKSV